LTLQKFGTILGSSARVPIQFQFWLWKFREGSGTQNMQLRTQRDFDIGFFVSTVFDQQHLQIN